MSNPAVNDKRTRSQVTLPDDILLHLPQTSPLKDARIALKNMDTPPHGAGGSPVIEDTDDELLLSPSKDGKRPVLRKRSVSPSDLEHGSNHPGGHDSKRLRRDMPQETLARPRRNGHKRIFSEPDALPGAKTKRKRIAGPGSKKPHSSGTSPIRASSPPTPGTKERSRSVPLFTMNVPIPHLDFNKLPESFVRNRSRSRSPSKERDNRLLIVVEKLNPILDETVVGGDDVMNEPLVDGDNEASKDANTISVPPDSATAKDVAHAPPNESATVFDTSEVPPPSPIQHRCFSVPQTPAQTPLELSFPLSPLTPLPETPHPSKFNLRAPNRYTGGGWGRAPDERAEDDLLEIQMPPPSPQTHLKPTPGPSRLPRLSSNLSLSAAFSADISVRTGSSKLGAMLPSAIQPEPKTTSLVVASGTSAAEPKLDAFAVLMKGQKKPIQSLKGKTRAAARPHTEKPGAASQEGLDAKAKPRTSLKAKMRPREKPPKPSLIPLSLPTGDETGHRSTPPSPRPVSPTPTFGESGPPTPIQDKSMQDLVAPGVEVQEVEPVLNKDAPTLDPPQVVEALVSLEPTDSRSQPSQNVPDPLKFVPSSSRKEPKKEVAKPRTLMSKLPLGKKHLGAPTTPFRRVTRSAALKPIARRASPPIREPLRLAGSAAADELTEAINTTTLPVPTEKGVLSDLSDLSDLPTDPEDELVPPGSPMKLETPTTGSMTVPIPSVLQTPKSPLSSPAKLTKTPKRASAHPHSSPSPTKIAKTDLMSRRKRPASLSRSLTLGARGTSGSSSLSTLANALEKLRMPPPMRPNTSMGFNRDMDDEDDAFSIGPQSQDDAAIGKMSSKDKQIVHLSRSATLGKMADRAEMGGPPEKDARTLFHEPLFARGNAGPSKLLARNGLGAQNGRPTASRIFAPGSFGLAATRGRLGPKVSRKTNLPSVMASPVKGAGEATEDSAVEVGPLKLSAGADADLAHILTPKPGPDSDNQVVSSTGKGKEKADTFKKDASRRASMALQALSQSLNALPVQESNIALLMGPPVTPRGPGRSGLRSSSSNYPSSAGSSRIPEPATATNAGNAGAAKTAPGALSKIKGGSGGHVSSRRKGGDAASTTSTTNTPLPILKNCVVFVDVKTDSGEEAGALFVEMLENIGARLLTRVGQTCTHIVFKNGFVSTTKRYRELRDPKPLVVGVTWVVECVEQRRQVDETKFLIDLDNVNVAGINKRRRSMLPKLISHQPDDAGNPSASGEHDYEGDHSIDGSNSSMILDDDLVPLERARRRRNVTTS